MRKYRDKSFNLNGKFERFFFTVWDLFTSLFGIATFALVKTLKLGLIR